MLKDADPHYFAGVYIVCGYTDLRFGIDSLAAIIERRFHMHRYFNVHFFNHLIFYLMTNVFYNSSISFFRNFSVFSFILFLNSMLLRISTALRDLNKSSSIVRITIALAFK